MPGIRRINIISDNPKDNLGYRGEISTNHIKSINKIYRDIFTLEDGEDVINVKKTEMYANMDIFQGIDVILTDTTGRVFTLQEKMLTFNGTSTVTYEKYKGSGKPGGYFYCTANYYFVAYNKNYNKENYEIDEYMLLDNNSLRLDDDIEWIAKQNKGDRKSPTQSAGELKDLYNRSTVDHAALFATYFRGNDGNWYRLYEDKNGTWRWSKQATPKQLK